ncbi:unnamed protein product [Ectocarpus sp. CCAP 1310/34]|nr:unnamed protein product [Ectocarpus sp. CCAP 1310/34]
MASLMAEDGQDGFGGLFDGASTSDDDDSGGEEAGPALVEEIYTRTPPTGSAGGRGALPPRPSTLRLSLVNSRHSLWGHRLWNAALLLAGMYADIAYIGGCRCTTVSPHTEEPLVLATLWFLVPTLC